MSLTSLHCPNPIVYAVFRGLMRKCVFQHGNPIDCTCCEYVSHVTHSCIRCVNGVLFEVKKLEKKSNHFCRVESAPETPVLIGDAILRMLLLQPSNSTRCFRSPCAWFFIWFLFIRCLCRVCDHPFHYSREIK